jgi:predicted Fe-Mo cluster-binding NifX family protein
MKIAISVWENKVSPVFDSAAHILIADTENNTPIKQEIISVESLTIFQRIDLLKKLNIDLLICGGITQNTLENIIQKNIKISPFICGEASKILKAVLKGKNIVSLFSMPGQKLRRDDS